MKLHFVCFGASHTHGCRACVGSFNEDAAGMVGRELGASELH